MSAFVSAFVAGLLLGLIPAVYFWWQAHRVPDLELLVNVLQLAKEGSAAEAKAAKAQVKALQEENDALISAMVDGGDAADVFDGVFAPRPGRTPPN